jgi:hypothetical protein
VAALLVLAAGCGRTSEQTGPEPKARVERAKPPATGPQRAAESALKFATRKVNLTWQEGGKPKLTATARELTGNTVSGTAAMKQVSAQLYDKGKVVARLSAPLVEADEKTRVVTATGGVTITSAVPNTTIRTVNADWVKWYSREDKLVGNGGVTARGPVASIKAAAFVADTRLRTIRVTAEPSEAQAVLGTR